MGLYLIIMGVQGAGKGTQAAFVNQRYDIPHVSTGDLFRAMKTRQDELARRVQEIMQSGQLVSDETTNEVLRDRLEQPDAADGVILDGYPRNLTQAAWLEEYLHEKGEQLSAALLLDLDPYSAFKRAYGRVTSAQTGETYNIYFNNEGLEWNFVEHPQHEYPPRIEVTLKQTGEKLVRRADDEAPAVIKRIDTYLETTQPLIGYYREKDVLIEIDASETIAEVSRAIQDAIDEIRQQTA